MKVWRLAGTLKVLPVEHCGVPTLSPVSNSILPAMVGSPESAEEDRVDRADLVAEALSRVQGKRLRARVRDRFKWRAEQVQSLR